MPTVLNLGESKIPELIEEFLIARRADADFPTPSGDDLPIVAGPFKGDPARAFPSLEIWVASLAFPRRRDEEVYEVHLDLYADKSTALATELGWLASIRRAFGGKKSAFEEWILVTHADPEADEPRGWQIIDCHITSGQTQNDGQRVCYQTILQVTYRGNVLTI